MVPKPDHFSAGLSIGAQLRDVQALVAPVRSSCALCQQSAEAIRTVLWTMYRSVRSAGSASLRNLRSLSDRARKGVVTVPAIVPVARQNKASRANGSQIA
jgi:hypothetical protein